MQTSWHVKKGDKVIVIAGKDKGKSGEITRVVRSKSRVYVGGVNMIKKHQRPTKEHPGGVIEKEASIHVSNVAHVDPKSGKATRVGKKILKDGTKERFAKASGETIK